MPATGKTTLHVFPLVRGELSTRAIMVVVPSEDLVNEIFVAIAKQIECPIYHIVLWKYQNGPTPILDGRYSDSPNTIAPPIEDFHYAFASFVAQYRDEQLQPPEEFVRKVAELMDTTAQISVDENRRSSTTRSLLRRLLSASFTQLVNKNRTSADHMISYNRETAPFGVAGLAIVEEKAELGFGGDGSVQGSFSYAQHWTDRNQNDLLTACFCPSFVIARVFYALGTALARLRSFYSELEEPSDEVARFFPLATAYKDGERVIKFKYVAYLKDTAEACFVERYGAAAHRLLASHGLAPQLLYYGDIWLSEPERNGCGSRKMVVMEYVEGMNAHMMLDSIGQRALPAGALAAVKRAVKLLHDQGMVHGDIRLGNVIIANPTAGDEEDMDKRVRIVDFDWAGEAGSVRYPLYLSKVINWPVGVADYAYITAEHDNEMARRMA
ncbi:hypothetical protein L227DRAFT_585871 [Lentinus tigrinus ALCF2SS1-6]|uniref:Protein kinase domain-containing protein n=1 Tax=Lentinus tigrinus ALCF2SS1-6 TaxID=1328759 RepID=A0A5C2SAK1_9APHY|nr:hypothetical protein L227DRAFT_585871 [Lentinus tigrinus ALCF2SS1-6]